MSTVINSKKTTFYRPELDGLRFFAFFSVYVGHASSSVVEFYTNLGIPYHLAKAIVMVVSSGRAGVPLFFVLSSYLITELLVREEEATGRIHVRSFYIRRALRIWPLYFVIVFLSYLFTPASSEYAMSTSFFLSLICFAGNIPYVIGSTFSAGFLGHLWSVSVEEHFYLVWPWLLRVTGGAKHLPRLATVLIIIATVLRLGLTLLGYDFQTFWYNTVTWIDAIAAGALLTYFLKKREIRLSPLARLALMIAGPTCWVIANLVLSQMTTWSPPIYYPLITAGSILCLLGAIGGPFLKSRMLVYLGRISYGLYVFHWLAFLIAGLMFERYSLGNWVIALLVTIGLASVSFYVLERPFLRLKSRFTYIPSRDVNTTAVGST